MSLDLDGLVACVTGRWRPEIGDPSAMGWATVGAYFAAASLAFAVAARGGGPPSPTQGAERRFWIAIGLALSALGVNKQLDLQSALTATGRCVAIAGGWYAERATVQLGFIIGLSALALAAGIVAAALLRGALARQWIALLGMTMLAGFVMIRAVGFHHVDALIGLRMAGWRMNWLLELGGLATVALGAIRALIAIRGAGPARRTMSRQEWSGGAPLETAVRPGDVAPNPKEEGRR